MIKPWGYDNYLVLKEEKDVLDLLKESVDGDEFILRIQDMEEKEYDKLGDFEGFEGA